MPWSIASVERTPTIGELSREAVDVSVVDTATRSSAAPLVSADDGTVLVAHRIAHDRIIVPRAPRERRTDIEIGVRRLRDTVARNRDRRAKCEERAEELVPRFGSVGRMARIAIEGDITKCS